MPLWKRFQIGFPRCDGIAGVGLIRSCFISCILLHLHNVDLTMRVCGKTPMRLFREVGLEGFNCICRFGGLEGEGVLLLTGRVHEKAARMFR